MDGERDPWNAEQDAWDAIATATGCSSWDYPGQLVRDVQKMAAELAKLRAAPTPHPLDAAVSAFAHLRTALEEIRDNCEAAWRDRALPHFGRDDLARACSMTADAALKADSARAHAPPLDAACAELAALAKDKMRDGVGRVTADVWDDGRVEFTTWGGTTWRAHLHGADGLPTPSQALAALVKP